MIKISKLKANPDNPRIIKDGKFFKLVNNVLLYSKFLVKRPIVHKDFVVQGGNMRYKAVAHILYLEENHFIALTATTGLTEEQIQAWKAYRKSKSIPDEWIANAEDFTAEELEAFIIIDNSDFGEWNMDDLANKYDTSKLTDWGVDLHGWGEVTPIAPNSANPMLDVDGDDQGPEAPRRMSATDDDYAMFEQVLDKEDKKILLEVLNQVKESEQLEKLGDALMHIIRFYQAKQKTKK